MKNAWVGQFLPTNCHLYAWHWECYILMLQANIHIQTTPQRLTQPYGGSFRRQMKLTMSYAVTGATPWKHSSALGCRGRFTDSTGVCQVGTKLCHSDMEPPRMEWAANWNRWKWLFSRLQVYLRFLFIHQTLWRKVLLLGYSFRNLTQFGLHWNIKFISVPVSITWHDTANNFVNIFIRW